MQSALWTHLLRQVPAAQLQRLTIFTNVGAEIAIQEIIQMAEEYLILRGRLQGTSDAGRLFLVPFDQINFISSQVEMKDDAIRAIFCNGSGAAYVAPAAVRTPPPAATAAPGAQEPAPAPAEPQPASAEPADGEASEPSTQPSRPAGAAGPMNRNELLERLRTRSHNGTPFRPST